MNLEFVKKEIGGKSVALYSVTQNCFHIEQVRDYIITNFQTLTIKTIEDDWALIGIFDSDLQAHDFIEEIRKNIPNKK